MEKIFKKSLELAIKFYFVPIKVMWSIEYKSSDIKILKYTLPDPSQGGYTLFIES
jgi:hypothetical protein